MGCIVGKCVLNKLFLLHSSKVNTIWDSFQISNHAPSRRQCTCASVLSLMTRPRASLDGPKEANLTSGNRRKKSHEVKKFSKQQKVESQIS